MADTKQHRQYNLKWNNHRSTVFTVFDELFQNNAFTDVTLAVQGTSIKCHRVVLAACSSYFQSLFLDNPCSHPVVVFRDIRKWEIYAILEYMYRGEVCVDPEELPSFLQVAEALRIKGLFADSSKQNCITTLEELSSRAEKCGRIADPVSPLVPSSQPTLCPVKEDIKDVSSHSEKLIDSNVENTDELNLRKKPAASTEGLQTPGRNGELFQNCEKENPAEETLFHTNGQPSSAVEPPSPKTTEPVNGHCQVRNPRWKHYKNYTSSDVNAAVEAIRNGMSAVQASRKFKVPRRTLYDKVKKLGIAVARPYFRLPSAEGGSFHYHRISVPSRYRFHIAQFDVPAKPGTDPAKQ